MRASRGGRTWAIVILQCCQFVTSCKERNLIFATWLIPVGLF